MHNLEPAENEHLYKIVDAKELMDQLTARAFMIIIDHSLQTPTSVSRYQDDTNQLMMGDDGIVFVRYGYFKKLVGEDNA